MKETMKTIEELRESLERIYDTTDLSAWCKECQDTIFIQSEPSFYKDIENLDQALKELEQYRNNPPLTFEDIKIGDWVWYNEPIRVEKGYYKIIDIDVNSKKYILSRQSSLGVVLDVFYKDDSFYAKEVKE